MKWYEKIKEYRLDRGWTQDELAEKMGYKDRTSIAKIESGAAEINQTQMYQFSKVLGVYPVDLYLKPSVFNA